MLYLVLISIMVRKMAFLRHTYTKKIPSFPSPSLNGIALSFLLEMQILHFKYCRRLRLCVCCLCVCDCLPFLYGSF